jgi:hypothetical protein
MISYLLKKIPALLPLLWVTPAGAGDALQPGAMELYPTPIAVGIDIPYTGDDNRTAAAELSWRRQGQTTWRHGVDMTIDRDQRRIWASIWPLEQGERIEVKVDFRDADAPGLPAAQASVTVRKLILAGTSGRALHVSPAGDDSGPGTQDRPFRTLAHAAKQVKPGDIVHALSGVYAEGDLFQRLRGTADRPIVFAAAPGQKPVLDSSLVLRKDSAAWKKLDQDLHVASVELPLGHLAYVAQDGLRSFRYASLADLKSDRGKVRRAWFYDDRTKSLYVRTGTGTDANGHAYHLSRHDYAVLFSGSQHVVVRGFEIRNYGAAAVRFSEGAKGCVLVENVIANATGGIFMKTPTTEDTVIWHNDIHEPGLADFGWTAIKESEYGRQGIYCDRAGRGTSICHNHMHGWFDCIAVESWKNPTRLEYNRDCDIMFNELYNAGDDAIEADGGGVNMRIHGNRMRHCFAALSLAPVERGPLYCTRNDATYLNLMFKLNVAGCTSLGWAYCDHNSGYCLTTGADGGTAISFPPTIPCANKVFRNNVIICNEWSVRAGQKHLALDHNCYYHVPGKPPRKFQWDAKPYASIDAFRKASGQETHGLYVDPRFQSHPDLGIYSIRNALSENPLARDTSTGDLRLQANSPCIDAGVVIRGLNEDFAGKAPDMGAFETGKK